MMLSMLWVLVPAALVIDALAFAAVAWIGLE